jgi:signal-transduction protein with cAMP-binding, CBS, and nucleotidyltransferase domain
MSSEILDEPVSRYTNTKLIVVESQLTTADAAKVMTEEKVGSILVFEDSEIVGIVTNKDIIAQVVAKGLDSSKVTIKQIMHSPLIKIHKDAKVKEAIDIMTRNDIRRLVVTDDKRTIGTITRKKIVGNMYQHTEHLHELEEPRNQS